MTYFDAKAEYVGGFMVRAEWLNGTIDVIACDGRGIQYAESFTADESGIHCQSYLQSYCECMMAQWKRTGWKSVGGV